MGMAVLSMGALTEERKLHAVSAPLKDFAKKARAQALLEQRPFMIEFQQGYVTVSALHQVSDEMAALKSMRVVEGDAAEATERKRFEVPEGVAIELMRWGSAEWVPARSQAWVFEQTGICEPLKVRVSSQRGWIEMEFNPLTASVADEANHFE
jgi:hypothetical protein